MSWLGQWFGQWFGRNAPAPAGALAGTATLRLAAAGALNAPPLVVWASGTARLGLIASGAISTAPVSTFPFTSGAGHWLNQLTKPRTAIDDDEFLLAVLL